MIDLLSYGEEEGKNRGFKSIGFKKEYLVEWIKSGIVDKKILRWSFLFFGVGFVEGMEVKIFDV